MGPPARIGFALLAAYSAWLAGLELRTSQAHVRPYFSDIEGEALLFAVNTSLSVALLAGTALLMVFAAATGGRKPGRAFLISQAGMFALLACDDRFQLHERIGWRLGVEDHYVMAVWAAAEVALLGLFCRPALVTMRMAGLFVGGGACFALMMAFDAVVPHDAAMRLSIEDLAKVWGAALFLAFGWEAARAHLRRAPEAASEPRKSVTLEHG